MLSSKNKKYDMSIWTKEDDKLMLAVTRRQVDKVRDSVVKKKIDPSRKNVNTGTTAFHHAIQEGFEDIFNIMLNESSSIRIDSKDVNGLTPLHYAVHKARYAIAEKLILAKAAINSSDFKGRSTLHHACEGGHLGCVKLLLDNAADPQASDTDGKTALFYAAEKGQSSICRLLIEKNADVNHQDVEKRTALMMAASKGHVTTCQYLITKGALTDSVDSRGHNAEWYASTRRYTDVVKVFRNSNNQLEKTHSKRLSSTRIEFETETDNAYEPIGSARKDESDSKVENKKKSDKKPQTPPRRILPADASKAVAESAPLDESFENYNGLKDSKFKGSNFADLDLGSFRLMLDDAFRAKSEEVMSENLSIPDYEKGEGVEIGNTRSLPGSFYALKGDDFNKNHINAKSASAEMINSKDSKMHNEISDNSENHENFDDYDELVYQLQLTIEERNALLSERKSLLKEHSQTIQTLDWIRQELSEMMRFVDEALRIIGQMKRQEDKDVSLLKNELVKFRAQIDTLLKMEVTNIEDVSIYVSSKTNEGAPKIDGQSLRGVSERLKHEKNGLLSKLGDILKENRSLQEQMRSVETLMLRAKELKEENEGLISDYRKLQAIQDTESAEVEDLMKSYKETLEENEILRNNQEKMTLKLNKLSTNAESSDLRDENSKLREEKLAMENECSKQEKIINDLKERLDEIGQIQKERVDQMRSDDLETDHSRIENMEELKMAYTKMVEEYEVLQNENTALRINVNRKNAEAKELKRNAEDLNDQLQDAFVEFRNALKIVHDGNNAELTMLKEENKQLILQMNQLKSGFLKETPKITDEYLKKSIEIQTDANHKKMDIGETDEEVKYDLIDASKLQADTKYSPLFQDLQNAMVETQKLLQENFALKQALSKKHYLHGSEKVNDNDEKIKLVECNKELQFEIRALKRTIDEQSVYLSRVGEDEKGPEVVVFPTQSIDERNALMDYEERSPFKANDEKDTMIKYLENDIINTNKKNDDLQTENDQLRNNLITMISELNEQKRKGDKQPLNEQNLNEANRLLDQKDKQIFEYEQILQSNQNELDYCHQMQDECSKIIADYKEVISELESCEALTAVNVDDEGDSTFSELRQWVRNFQNQENSLNDLKKENEFLNSEIKRLSADPTKPEQKDIHEKELELKVSLLQHHLDEKHDEILGLRMKLNDIQTSENIVRQQVERMKLHLDEKEERIITLGELALKEQQKLQKENEVLRNTIKKQMPNLPNEYEEQLLSEIEFLTVKVSSLQKEISIKELEMEKIKKDLIDELNELKSHKSVQIESGQSQLYSANNYKEIIDLKNEIQESKINHDKIILEKENTIKNQINKNDLLNKKINELNDNLENEINRRCLESKQEITNMQEELHSLKNENVDLLKQIKTYRSNYETLAKENKLLKERAGNSKLTMLSDLALDDARQKIQKLENENKQIIEENIKLKLNGCDADSDIFVERSETYEKTSTEKVSKLEILTSKPNGAAAALAITGAKSLPISIPVMKITDSSTRTAIDGNGDRETRYTASSRSISTQTKRPDDDDNKHVENELYSKFCENRNLLIESVELAVNLFRKIVAKETKKRGGVDDDDDGGENLFLTSLMRFESHFDNDGVFIEALRGCWDSLRENESMKTVVDALADENERLNVEIEYAKKFLAVGGKYDPNTATAVDENFISHLQRQLVENDRRYKFMISIYRKHLLKSVQNDLDSSVKDMITKIAKSELH